MRILWLHEVETQPQSADSGVDIGHGIDAAFVENEAVVVAVCGLGVVIDHGFVFVGHRYVLMCKFPTGRLNACVCSGGRGVGVEVVEIGQIGSVDDAVFQQGEVQSVGAGTTDAVYIVVGVGAGVGVGSGVAGGSGVGCASLYASNSSFHTEKSLFLILSSN